jgi:hypothetical protein
LDVLPGGFETFVQDELGPTVGVIVIACICRQDSPDDIGGRPTLAVEHVIQDLLSSNVFGLARRAFFHLSTATKTSSAPSAKMTKIPVEGSQ